MPDTNLLSLYMRHCGTSEVPSCFNLWSGISMIAAAVRDTVYLDWFKGTPTKPNLFVFLIGPSGIGKEKAINTAARYIAELPHCYLYGGRATGPALIDEFANRPVKMNGHMVVSSPLYFVTEELNMSIRGGEQSQDLLSFATGIYGGKSYPLKERTRSRGTTLVIPNPCLNWLAGTTEEWMMRSIPKDAIEGGFFARVLAIVGQKDYSVRHPRPLYPPDYEELKATITQRVKHLSDIEGEITVSDNAWAWHDTWYQSRPAPEDSLLRASFNRADEMMLKLAMILSLAEWDSIHDPDGYAGTIEVRHFEGALELWESVAATLPAILRCTASNYHDAAIQKVEELMRKVKAIGHGDLVQKSVPKGLRSADVVRAIRELADRGDVDIVQLGKGKAYRWMGGA